MILCDWQIKQYIEYGQIIIDPYDEALINPSSIDIRLGNQYTITKPVGKYIDPLDKETFKTETKAFDFNYLRERETILVSMYEYLALSDNISAKIVGKSSLARLGLDNSSQAGWIDAGWKGIITLELTNIGDNIIKLTKGMKIGQLIFFKHERSSKPYNLIGRYVNQTPGQGSLGI